jgi:hypothetical protein
MSTREFIVEVCVVAGSAGIVLAAVWRFFDLEDK